jgi:hypothetical protein
MKPEPVTCYYCRRPAIAICDHVRVRPLSDCLTHDGDMIITCGRPICPEHRRLVGHVCDRSRRTTNNQSDTIDHCREHESR